MAGAFSVGAISGGAFNPAVGIGPAIISFFGNTQSVTHIALYLLGPLTGAILASVVYSFVLKVEKN